MESRSSDNPSNTNNGTDALHSEQNFIKVLRPYNKMRNITDPKTLLVLASEGCLNVPEDLKTFTEGDPAVDVLYSSQLPLRNYDRHAPVEAIALVCKIFNEDSVEAVRRNIPYIDVRYLTGKCFILAVAEDDHGVDDVEVIEDLAGKYCLPVHYISKSKSIDKGRTVSRLQVPHRLMSIYCPPPSCKVSTATVFAAINCSFD